MTLKELKKLAYRAQQDRWTLHADPEHILALIERVEKLSEALEQVMILTDMLDNHCNPVLRQFGAEVPLE